MCQDSKIVAESRDAPKNYDQWPNLLIPSLRVRMAVIPLNTRSRILTVLSLATLIGIGAMTVLFPVSEMQFESSMDTIAYETAAIRE